MLVEIHGQHDERALADPAAHRRLLDAFGGLERQADEIGGLWQARRTAETAVAEHQREVERAQREAEFLRHAVDELRKLAPEAGEETALAERRTSMMQGEKVATDLRDAFDAVAGSASPVPALAAAVRRLERRQGQAPELIGPAGPAFDTALNALEEARGHLQRALASADHDPAELERIEKRLFALRAASRKYNVPIDGLAALRARFAADLELIDAGAQRLAQLAEAAREADARFDAAAAALAQARRRSASRLDKAVNAELAPLRLERAKFSTNIERAEPGPTGTDRVEFWVQTNPGHAARAIADEGRIRVVSSPVSCSPSRSCWPIAAPAPTLVFDEVDTGVGGAVADAIGLRLARLGRREVQVLAVTHAPQVAARAQHHYLISKDALDKGKRVATRVTELAPDRRREEIARMLAGAEITAEARAAAERLMRASG